MMKRALIENPIRAVAVAVVVVISMFVMFMAWWINNTLASPKWCATALGAEKATPGNTIKGLEACIDLLTIQLGSLGVNSHILFGTLALCLLVLIVIVIAGGELSLSASKSGINANIGRDEADAADQVAAAAADEAREIKEGG